MSFESPYSEITFITEAVAAVRDGQSPLWVEDLIKQNLENDIQESPFFNLLVLAVYGISPGYLNPAQENHFQSALAYFRQINSFSLEDIRYKDSIALIARDGSSDICSERIFNFNSNSDAAPLEFPAYRNLVDEIVSSFKIETTDPDFTRRCATYLSELLSNTYQHARYDYDGSGIKNSIRGVYIKRHNDVPPPFVSDVGKHQQQKSTYLELSVFDLGPGLAQRWSSRPLNTISLQQEYDFAIQCFNKHSTSSGQVNRGRGLSRMLWVLSNSKSTLYLRTGHLSQFRDSSTLGETRWLRDTDAHIPEPREHKASAGTIVSILVPA